jgi:hypothetical protein
MFVLKNIYKTTFQNPTTKEDKFCNMYNFAGCNKHKQKRLKIQFR